MKKGRRDAAQRKTLIRRRRPTWRRHLPAHVASSHDPAPDYPEDHVRPSLRNAPHPVCKQTVGRGRPTTVVSGGGRGTRKTGGDYSPIHLYTSPTPLSRPSSTHRPPPQRLSPPPCPRPASPQSTLPHLQIYILNAIHTCLDAIRILWGEWRARRPREALHAPCLLHMLRQIKTIYLAKAFDQLN